MSWANMFFFKLTVGYFTEQNAALEHSLPPDPVGIDRLFFCTDYIPQTPDKNFASTCPTPTPMTCFLIHLLLPLCSFYISQTVSLFEVM